jgi:flavin-dependent dehydrogenase
MRVSIVGDGIAGRTLHRILKIRGLEIDLYGQEKHTRCNIRSCGFGTSASCIKLVSKLGINPNEYVLRHDNYLKIDGRIVKADLYWIDKPKLLAAIANDIRYDQPNIDDYDVIVDATGVTRVYSSLFPYFIDKIATSYQQRVILNNRAEPAFDIIRGGYLWTIPLGGKEAHIGGGSTILAQDKVKQMVLGYAREKEPNEIICSCSESVRVSGPIFPLVSDKFITVGESAGLVVPFGVAGIYTSFSSAIILANYIVEDNIAEYDMAMRRRFGWLRSARNILEEVERGQVKLLSLGSSYRTLRYQGLKPTLMDLLYIRRILMEANK